MPESGSLKNKRKIVKSLVEKVWNRFRVSIAEVGHHDLHQRAEIALAAVAQSEGDGRRIADGIRGEIERMPGLFVTLWDLDWVELR